MRYRMKYAGYLMALASVLVTTTVAAGRDDAFGMSERKRIPSAFIKWQDAPVIDGDISDAVWAGATVVEDFHQVRPVEFAAPSERTIVRVLQDENHLYISATLFTKDPSRITAKQMAQGLTTRYDDRFYVVLDPFNNKRSGYRFDVTPNGLRSDALFDGPNYMNFEWQGIWRGDARRTAEGWTVEMAIPFKTISFNPKNSTWGITFGRNIRRGNETIAWTSYAKDTGPASAGEITGIKNPRQGVGLDIVAAFSVARRRDHVTGQSDWAINPSVDVFYKITPSLTAVITTNTDFSATEVDDRVVNLGRFSVFFPEKRDFFLQDADIFSFGGIFRNGQPFFSRRIGIGDGGEPLDLKIGAKLAGRIGRFNIGLLDVLQQGSDGVSDRNLFVGRLSANVLEESSVGMIVTNGDPLQAEKNSVIGFDFNYQSRSLIEGYTVRGSAWYQRSFRDDIATDEEAYGVSLSLPSQDRWGGWVGYKAIEANFDPALGFVNRRGIHMMYGNIQYTWRLQNSWLNRVRPSLKLMHVQDQNGNTESQEIELRPFGLESHSRDQMDLDLKYEREVLTEPFEISEGIIIQPGDYDWKRAVLSLSSGQARTLFANIKVGVGNFYTGTRLNIQPGIGWSPSSRLMIKTEYKHWDIKLAEGDFLARIITLNTSYAFTSTLSWSNLVQYDNQSDTMGLNSRIHWVPESGQDLYFVVNYGFDTRDTDDLSRPALFRANQSEIVLKGAYTFRF